MKNARCLPSPISFREDNPPNTSAGCQNWAVVFIKHTINPFMLARNHPGAIIARKDCGISISAKIYHLVSRFLWDKRILHFIKCINHDYVTRDWRYANTRCINCIKCHWNTLKIKKKFISTNVEVEEATGFCWWPGTVIPTISVWHGEK